MEKLISDLMDCIFNEGFAFVFIITLLIAAITFGIYKSNENEKQLQDKCRLILLEKGENDYKVCIGVK